jgi:hypothetical protein
MALLYEVSQQTALQIMVLLEQKFPLILAALNGACFSPLIHLLSQHLNWPTNSTQAI